MADAETFEFTVEGRASRWMRPGQDNRHGKGMRFTDKKAAEGKRAIAWEAKKVWGGRKPVCGPVRLHVRAVFEIPVSWPKAVQAAARECRVPHVADPDLDQIVKQVMDALIGLVWEDDNQVVSFGRSYKRYGDAQRTDIIVEILPQQEDEITPGQRRTIKRQAERLGLAPPSKKRPRAIPSKVKRIEGESDSISSAVARMLGGN